MSVTQQSLILQHLRRLAGTHPDAGPSDVELLASFAARGDEAAFAVLVRRHGPTVLNVCRSVLHHEQDAEDAFQATFVILARKADSIKQRASVAGWLHEVAHRVALKTRAAASRRSARERKVTPMAAADPALDMTLRDLWRVLHEELRRLPDKYRLPLVLCYLEGRSQADAAAQLGWRQSTLRGRLERGREHLRRRLAARGVALAAVFCTAAVTSRATSTELVDAAVRAAASGADGAVSSGVYSLAEEVMRAMSPSKVKIISAVLLAASLLAGAGALVLRASAAEKAPAGQRPEPEFAVEPAKSQPADDKNSIAYDGRVVGPQGQPVAGARIWLIPSWRLIKRPPPSPLYATSGSDGRFQFQAKALPVADIEMALAATAPGFGVGWLDIATRDSKSGLTLHLVKDDAPVAGQVFDLQGKPVEGATVHVMRIQAVAEDAITPWLEAVKKKDASGDELEGKYLTRMLMNEEIPDLPREVATDREGRFRLSGIGRDRKVEIRLSGPTIASTDLHVLTRPGEPIEAAKIVLAVRAPVAPRVYYGATFRYAAAPAKPVIGVVRDKDTQRPMAGVIVQSYKLANSPFHGMDLVQTTTDAQGFYRLVGMPKGNGNEVLFVPPDDQPYLLTARDVPDSPGLDPVKVDVELKRGVWIEGKITDKGTGKPIPHANVAYYPLASNRFVKEYPGLAANQTNRPFREATKDGSYRIVGLPGRGLIAVQYRDHYLLALERDDEEGAKEPFLNTLPVLGGNSVNAAAPVDVPAGAESVKRDVTLDPGRTFKGAVQGPDGKPLAGVRAFCLSGWGGWGLPPLDTAEFTVYAFNPRRPRPILFRYPAKGLVGVLEPPKDASHPVTVQMRPGASIIGRLVDAAGQPRGNARAMLFGVFRYGAGEDFLSPEEFQTDASGRFRLDGLLPGYHYMLYDRQARFEFGRDLRDGETTDLGDVRIMQPGQ
jgi:RNA polymerase sigma factor (sigma-70 family)